MGGIRLLVNAYIYVLLARAIMSWVPVGSNSNLEQFRRLLLRLTEPVLAPVRRLLPMVRIGATGVDFSIFVVILLLGLLVRSL